MIFAVVQKRLPFQVKAVQVDGGNEFRAEFEQSCQEKEILLFVLPSRSPKLNGCVERAHCTHVKEFFHVYADDWGIPTLKNVLQERERVYNFIRPYVSQDNLTPHEYFKSHYPKYLPHMFHKY